MLLLTRIQLSKNLSECCEFIIICCDSICTLILFFNFQVQNFEETHDFVIHSYLCSFISPIWDSARSLRMLGAVGLESDHEEKGSGTGATVARRRSRLVYG